jgi:hypothetical protein
MKTFLALALSVVTQVVTANVQEQRTMLRQHGHETRKLVDKDEAVDFYENFTGSSSAIRGTQGQFKQSRRGARRLRPEGNGKSTKSGKSTQRSVTSNPLPNDTPAPSPNRGSPTSAPTIDEGSARDADYFVNFPNGFFCDPPVPFFMDRNVNPSTAFNGQYPQLTPNGFNPNCTLRLLPDTPADVSTSAMQSFSFKPSNPDMRFRMEVGKSLFVLG